MGSPVLVDDKGDVLLAVEEPVEEGGEGKGGGYGEDLALEGEEIFTPPACRLGDDEVAPEYVADYRVYVPEVYRRVSELVGVDKGLFGTDYPLLRQGRLLKEIDSLELPPEMKEQILSGNARRLLGISED